MDDRCIALNARGQRCALKKVANDKCTTHNKNTPYGIAPQTRYSRDANKMLASIKKKHNLPHRPSPRTRRRDEIPLRTTTTRTRTISAEDATPAESLLLLHQSVKKSPSPKPRTSSRSPRK